MCGPEVLDLADETAAGDTGGEVSTADLAFLGAGEGKLGVGREDDVLDDVGAGGIYGAAVSGRMSSHRRRGGS
ncbi:hypothetical protein TIFTF001_001324 [Ficus carica]|uniref:Uncharacterized protein n=1 Tax=Ficus carica TaxID=3494 RepID=A0AA87Z6P5_FICCA|nr:hypothetical protein TIFTF001_001324 [Ficus carica]